MITNSRTESILLRDIPKSTLNIADKIANTLGTSRAEVLRQTLINACAESEIQDVCIITCDRNIYSSTRKKQ